MRILITGGTGSLGRAIVTRLINDQMVERLCIISRDEHKIRALADQYPEPNPLRWFVGDVRDESRLKIACQGVDAVIHAAALKRIDAVVNESTELDKTNVQGTLHLLQAAMDCGVRKVLFISSDKACLDYHARVDLADGTREPIGTLVNRKAAIEVRTIRDGRPSVARIVGWHKNKLSNREMVQLSFDAAYRHKGTGGRFWLTTDHLVMTTSGWVQAGELTDEHRLITTEPAPNDAQASLLCGMLLGDSSIDRGFRCRIRTSHAANQVEWLTVKHRALLALGCSDIRCSIGRGARQDSYEFAIRHSAWASEWRREWYEDKKIVPRKLIERHMSPSLLATWYMDDGCLSGMNARIATHGFTKEDVYWLAGLLIGRGIQAYAKEERRNKGLYYGLHFTVVGTRQLCQQIGRFVPLSMRYKLIKSAPDYEPEAWNLGSPESYIAKPVVRRGKFPRRNVYCLDIEETHAFSVGGVTVHNCQPTNAYGCTKMLAECHTTGFNSYSMPRGMACSAVRYGNVFGSTGSILHVWRQALKENKSLPLTDYRMTRFHLTLSQAVEFCLSSLMRMKGGEIFVPDLPAFRLTDLADAMGGKTVSTGLRPGGEKLAETMLSEEEPGRTLWQDDRYLVKPAHQTWSSSQYRGEPLEKDPHLRSDWPNRWMTVPQLKKVLEETP